MQKYNISEIYNIYSLQKEEESSLKKLEAILLSEPSLIGMTMMMTMTMTMTMTMKMTMMMTMKMTMMMMMMMMTMKMTMTMIFQSPSSQ